MTGRPSSAAPSATGGPSFPAPSEYRLLLRVDYAAMTWRGEVEFDLGPGTPVCTLDTEGLSIDRVLRDGTEIPFRRTAPEAAVSFDLPSAAASHVRIEYRGSVNTRSMNGIYRSRHANGYVLTTQCEPTGARAIFPCVDRPDRKARVLLRVMTDPTLEVVANGAVASTRDVDGLREWTFSPTPPMATYLFYLGIGVFESIERRSRHAAIRVLTPPGRRDAGRFAADAAARILDAFEEYYAIPYPLPKLDLIAIEELPFGAMENWGAISFQSNRILVDPSSGSFTARDVFETTSHEIAHQWFGNLVTMRWWTDIWLNESFAALMETKITDRLDPALDAQADFFLRVAGREAAIDGDSLRSTHPVRAAVESPEEIGQIFDEISYGKGSSVLAMLEAYLGADAFRRGVTDYLNRFRDGNAETEDLWHSLEAASGEAVSAIARPWIDRPGVPVVSARLGPAGIDLLQRKFRYLGSEDAPPWPIPIVAEIDGRMERVRFDTTRHTLPTGPDATVHLNPGALGFYRVLYDRTLYERLLRGLAQRPASDRWVLLEDLGAFLASGDVDWAMYARFAEAAAGCADRLTVESIGGTLIGFALDFPDLPHVQAAARSFFVAQTERLGPARRPGDSGVDGILRERVSFARTRIDAEYARSISSRFAEWDSLDPDFRLATAVGFARSGGRSGYRELKTALENSAIDADRARLIRSLSWTEEPDLIRETLDYAISGGANRSYLLWVIIQAASNPAGRPVVWPWFSERVDAIADVFHGSGSLPLVLERAVPSMAVGRVPEVRAFFADHPLPDGTRGVAKGLERLEIHERLHRHLATPHGLVAGSAGVG
ncbi:MAG: M1 family metallopeptidase [Thermoplasmata archaeon]